MDNVPEKFLNEDGTLNSEALIKSYSELEKKMGSMVSVPTEDADDEARQKFNRAIGVPTQAAEYPVNEMFDDEALRSKFHQMGLTSKQVENIYEIAEEFLTPVISELFQTGFETNATTELKKFFGSTEKMKEALTEINAFGEKFLPTDAFESLCTSAAGIQSIYKMMQSMEPNVTTDKNVVGNLSDSDLREMMRDPKYWREKDPEYIRKIESGFKKLYS